ncbi:MAG: 2OG-Fe(II) oxygenase [Alphaproteobacteria bacterium]|nr:2OG-Fe(II) oxygenase [Alphaproteobacteria bacterium]MCB9929175.1 2OG-Fe(II) oxygenase [Alphaproteobacteria bacterium]
MRPLALDRPLMDWSPLDWAALNWAALEADLTAYGYALTPPVLTADQCAALRALYRDDRPFRSRVVMARHAFGEGDYAYFADPLPPLIQGLRQAFYEGLAPMANRMLRAMGRDTHYPPTLAEYRAVCAANGQTKPTPLLLRYGEGGYNRLHRDLYGDLAFPLQATAMLSRPGQDFGGGQFLLVENRPRQQAIGTAVDIPQGSFILFPTNERPVQGARSILRASLRHGVSRVIWGERHTLGLIFHDAA